MPTTEPKSESEPKIELEHTTEVPPPPAPEEIEPSASDVQTAEPVDPTKPSATSYTFGVGLSQSTLTANFIDAAVGDAIWQTPTSWNLLFEIFQRISPEWSATAEVRVRRSEYESASSRLRDRKVTGIDFGASVIRHLDAGDIGIGLTQAAINPVVPLQDGRYQLTSFQCSFATLSWQKAFESYESLEVSPRLRLGMLAYAKGYGLTIKSGTWARAGVEMRWHLSSFSLFTEPYYEQRQIKSGLGLVSVKNTAIIVGATSSL